VKAHPGVDAIATFGWWRANRWLLLRRVSQLSILGLFVAGPWFGLWIVKGNLNASLTLDVLPLADPFVLLQSLVARHVPESKALTGAFIVLVFYALVGGRVYCSWVCPVNMVTDAAHWLRRRVGLDPGVRFPRATRFWLLGAALLVSAFTGTVAWEFVNPVSMLHRSIIFGTGAGLLVVLAVVLLDLLVTRHGWCGRLCPVGAFYSLVGARSVLRVGTPRRGDCNDCMDCFAVCPEPQVITPPLRGAEKEIGPVILSPQCTNCGRCIDVCSRNVFGFTTRFHNRWEAGR
jgi:ferredoxin-type protein NapH